MSKVNTLVAKSSKDLTVLGTKQFLQNFLSNQAIEQQKCATYQNTWLVDHYQEAQVEVLKANLSIVQNNIHRKDLSQLYCVDVVVVVGRKTMQLQYDNTFTFLIWLIYSSKILELLLTCESIYIYIYIYIQCKIMELYL